MNYCEKCSYYKLFTQFNGRCKNEKLIEELKDKYSWVVPPNVMALNQPCKYFEERKK